jgi:hypothetical protein
MHRARFCVAVSSSNRLASPAIQFKLAVPAQSRVSLCDASVRLKRLARHRLEEALPVELELLVLELALGGEDLALRVETVIEWLPPIGARVLPQGAVALRLLDVELLLLHPLLEVQLVEPACVRRAEIVGACAGALLQLEVECVVLLLHVQAARVGSTGGQGG